MKRVKNRIETVTRMDFPELRRNQAGQKVNVLFFLATTYCMRSTFLEKQKGCFVGKHPFKKGGNSRHWLTKQAQKSRVSDMQKGCQISPKFYSPCICWKRSIASCLNMKRPKKCKWYAAISSKRPCLERH